MMPPRELIDRTRVVSVVKYPMELGIEPVNDWLDRDIAVTTLFPLHTTPVHVQCDV